CKFSVDPDDSFCNIYGKIIDCSPFLKMECTIKQTNSFDVNTNLIGAYNAENVLAAVAIGDYFDIGTESIKHGLENYIPQNNRSQLTVTNKNKLVVDAYNANPTSMRAAILNFAQMEVEHKTLILGDMLELGEQSDAEHQIITDLLQQNKFESVLLVGPQFKKTHNSYRCFDDTDELINHIEQQPISGHYILIKGSRGIKLEKVLQKL
ncbi:MAG: cyanophycin synthetase, partial [Paludibacter sp.]